MLNKGKGDKKEKRTKFLRLLAFYERRHCYGALKINLQNNPYLGTFYYISFRN